MTSPRVVLVTGGNNGIGYETVKALLQSEKPYHVLLGSRSVEKGNLAIETLRNECPESTNIVELVQIDLNSDESIEQAFKQVKDSPGHIDTLVNNAGIITSLVSTYGDELTCPRSNLRHRIPRRQSLSEGMLQQSLRRQRLRHTSTNLHLHAPAPQVHRPAPTLHSRLLLPHRSIHKLPLTTRPRRLAQEPRFREYWVPV